MSAITWLMISISLFGIAAAAALIWSSSRQLAGGLGILGSAAAIISAGIGLTATGPATLAWFNAEPFGRLTLKIDGLSALMIGVIGLIGIAAHLYSLSSNRYPPSVAFFANIFMAAMLLVVTVANAFYFMVFWELMTLATYFLVIWRMDEEDSARTGFIYMLTAHAGAALILAAFMVLYLVTDSFDFDLIRHAYITPAIKNLVFGLVFVGFGAKIGIAPLHFWTPATYAAAPDHVSALMAGVMKKVAIYGLLRIGMDLLGTPPVWWGLTLILFGGFSIVVGVFYALTEKELKRLLAYSSVENAGIILLGVGIAMIGLAIQVPALTILGLLAGLYHTLNHAFFKSLLFLSAGSAIEAAGTADLNRMGGLARSMPITSLTFLTGALAVAAIPPLNGFVSEWLTYQAFFQAAMVSQSVMSVVAPLLAALLALGGAFAVMVYVKAYSSAFTGPQRSPAEGLVEEASPPARISQLYLALGCLALGVGAPFIVPVVARVAASFTWQPQLQLANGWQIYPGGPQGAILSPPFLALLLIGLLMVPAVLIWVYGGQNAGRRRGVDPWTCGYGYSTPMSLPGGSFDQPVQASFRPLYRLRTVLVRPFQVVAETGQRAVAMITRAEPVVETVVTRPTIRLLETAGSWIQALQMGDIRVYCLYIIITLAILLFAIFRGGGL